MEQPNSRPQWYRLAIVAAITAGVVSFWTVERVHPLRVETAIRIGEAVLYAPLRYRFTGMIFTPAFVAVVAFTLLMEWCFPVRPMQKLLSVSFAQDAVWFFYEGVLHAAIVVIYVTAIQMLYSRYVHVAVLLRINDLPDGARFAVGLLIVDFCYWIQHWVNHKVPVLWLIHSLHHSQSEINFFTDFRYHPLEYVVRETFLAIPFIVLMISIPDIIYFSVFRKWYTRFYHANIKTDLGVLRYVLVTPQSHRIHHSKEMQHQDRNFGLLFSIWDFIFGTQYKGFCEYPETGINDPEFPRETGRGVVSLLVTPLKQLLYPLRVMTRALTAEAERPRADWRASTSAAFRRR